MKSKIKQLFFSTINNYEREQIHRAHKLEALKVLAKIEKQLGKLEKENIKIADEYALDVLGSKKYAPWLYVYAAINRKFVEGWIPDNYYGFEVLPAINGDYRILSDIKNLTKRLLGTESIPDIGYLINVVVYSKKIEPILDPEKISEVLFENADTVFYKKNHSTRGKGVEIFSKSSFSLTEVLKKYDGVFQFPVSQHVFFSDIFEKSTATIRLTTINDNEGNVEVRAAYLRIGRGNDQFVKSESSIRIPIDKESGLLFPVGYSSDWSFFSKHPDSGYSFIGKTIPMFKEAKEKCVFLHKRFPFYQCIGWDVVIDLQNEVKILEWNAYHNDIKFSEATTGPCFLGLGWENLWREK